MLFQDRILRHIKISTNNIYKEIKLNLLLIYIINF